MNEMSIPSWALKHGVSALTATSEFMCCATNYEKVLWNLTLQKAARWSIFVSALMQVSILLNILLLLKVMWI